MGNINLDYQSFRKENASGVRECNEFKEVEEIQSFFKMGHFKFAKLVYH